MTKQKQSKGETNINRQERLSIKNDKELVVVIILGMLSAIPSALFCLTRNTLFVKSIPAIKVKRHEWHFYDVVFQ